MYPKKSELRMNISIPEGEEGGGGGGGGGGEREGGREGGREEGSKQSQFPTLDTLAGSRTCMCGVCVSMTTTFHHPS